MATKLPVFSWEEIRKHNHESSLWVVVRHDVFDVTKFIQKHPGGRHTLLIAGGQDVTYLMETSHPFNRKPWEILEKYHIGHVEGMFVEYPAENPFFNTFVKKAKNYFEKTGLDPKDPWPTLKTFAFLCAMWLIGYFGMCVGYKFSILCAALLGVSRALIGINTMHAASHFAVSHSPFVWRWLDWFCFDVLMGGSSLAWYYQHVIGHHQHTNVHLADPDLPAAEDGDIRRITPFQKWHDKYKHQVWYMPLLYTLFAFKVRITDTFMLLGNHMNGHIPMNIRLKDSLLLFATKAFFVYYQFYVPLFVFKLPLLHFIGLYCIAEVAVGTWLSYFFQVNHVSTVADYVDRNAPKVREWAVMQMEGTVDYAHDSWLFTFLSGTLNYQVIHHLLPSVAPHHYAALMPLLKEACKEHKVRHNYVDSFWQAAKLHLDELRERGIEKMHEH